MNRIRKNKSEALFLGLQLRNRRKEQGITLIQAFEGTRVNVGQLSRFEHGEFSFDTPNLQKFAAYLQVDLSKGQGATSLDRRFEAARRRSDRHEAAAAALVQALETLR